ncbi:hypothetical protein APR41_15260 [Salegentibacter salinarum]|uniref:Uncharacterized protein n=1 Tax=Salegentibacter salinarum TaxID=447422 RepID=A0A2N0TZF2_9FLAO|nr:hypothetical protein [Salegentibacter salinarum]PKD20028.1 hypothetical protein APR41_15260 [Salegentibacter salinarum]
MLLKKAGTPYAKHKLQYLQGVRGYEGRSRTKQENGKLRLYESWKWTSGDKSSGNSILEEL